MNRLEFEWEGVKYYIDAQKGKWAPDIVVLPDGKTVVSLSIQQAEEPWKVLNVTLLHSANAVQLT